MMKFWIYLEKYLKEEIIRAAVAEQMPDQPMTCPERALFFALRDIYSMYRKGMVSKTDGEVLKNRAMRQFALDNQAVSSAMMILKEHANFWKSVECAANRYRLDRTLENADAFLEAVYKVPIKAEYLEKKGDE